MHTWLLHGRLAARNDGGDRIAGSRLLHQGGVVPFHGWVPGAYTSLRRQSPCCSRESSRRPGRYAILRIMNVLHDVLKGAGASDAALKPESSACPSCSGRRQHRGRRAGGHRPEDMKRMLAWSSISQVAISCWRGLGSHWRSRERCCTSSTCHVQVAALRERAAVEEQTAPRHGQARRPGCKDEVTAGPRWWASFPRPGAAAFGLLEQTAHHTGAVAGWAALLCAVALLASLLTLAYFLIMQRKVSSQAGGGLEGIREGGAKFAVPR